MRLLVQGLVFFLMAHIMYIAAFSRGYVYDPLHMVAIVAIAVPLALFFVLLRSRAGRLAVPVFVYMLAIGAMVFFALTGEGRGTQKVMAAAGALLFLVSDAVLALDAFVRRIPHSSVIVWALYAPGQMLIALSCLRWS